MTETTDTIGRLTCLLRAIRPLRVAVSGGVDSMTLGLLAARTVEDDALICHAISPAVTREATERVQRIAAIEGWRLRLLEAGEFANSDYLRNPYDRCFYCKDSLYRAMADAVGKADILVSGTNQDDLDDYRPGLIAARHHRVRHPFVECGVGKSEIRRIARHLGYPDLAELPASPCLSSRVQTGLPIQADQLVFVHRVERRLQQALQPEVVRCRIQADGIAIQLDRDSLQRLNGAQSRWQSMVTGIAQEHGLSGSVRFEPYRMGSAFVAPR